MNRHTAKIWVSSPSEGCISSPRKSEYHAPGTYEYQASCSRISCSTSASFQESSALIPNVNWFVIVCQGMSSTQVCDSINLFCMLGCIKACPQHKLNKHRFRQQRFAFNLNWFLFPWGGLLVYANAGWPFAAILAVVYWLALLDRPRE